MKLNVGTIIHNEKLFYNLKKILVAKCIKYRHILLYFNINIFYWTIRLLNNVIYVYTYQPKNYDQLINIVHLWNAIQQ